MVFEPASAHLFQTVRVGQLATCRRIAFLPVTTGFNRTEPTTNQGRASSRYLAECDALIEQRHSSMAATTDMNMAFTGFSQHQMLPGSAPLGIASGRAGVPILAQSQPGHKMSVVFCNTIAGEASALANLSPLAGVAQRRLFGRPGVPATRLPICVSENKLTTARVLGAVVSGCDTACSIDHLQDNQ